jgi:hypothetical protein
MTRFSPIKLLLPVLLLVVTACLNDPAPDGLPEPEFTGVTVDEREQGSVRFTCGVSSMARVKEYGAYYSVLGAESASLDAEWTRLSGSRISEESFSVQLDGLLGGATYFCRFYISNGRYERLSEQISYCAVEPVAPRAPMLMEVCPTPDGRVYLPICGSLDCTVDWGDGTKDSYAGDYGVGVLANANVSHTYDGQSDRFTVTVSGTVTALSSVGLPDCTTITAVLDWGDTGLRDLNCAFLGQSGLKSVVAPAGALDNVTSFRKAFSETALTSLPDGLLSGAAGFEQTFKGCASLKTLPDKLFSAPGKLKELQETFADCTSLESLPVSLFKDCAGLEKLVSTFSGCTSLAGLPASLFDDCPAITVAEGVFMNCSSLAGESPYTEIDGVRVHLYQRDAYPARFAAIGRSYLCFFGCNGLSDFAQMPDAWKKP